MHVLFDQDHRLAQLAATLAALPVVWSTQLIPATEMTCGRREITAFRELDNYLLDRMILIEIDHLH